MNSTDAKAEQPANDGGPDPAAIRSMRISSTRRRALTWFAGSVIPLLAIAYLYFVFSSQPPVQPTRLQSLANESQPVTDQSVTAQPIKESPAQVKKPELKPLPIPAELPRDTSAMYAEADAVTGRLVEQYPEDPDALEVRARLHLHRGDTSEAVKAWQRCLQLNPNYPYAYSGLGSVAAKRGDQEAASNYYRQALKLAPESSQVRIGLAKARIDFGDVDEGIKVLEQQIQASPQEVEPYVLLGMAYTQRQNHEKAKVNYEAATVRDPGHANARWGLANACARLGLTDEAREHRQEFQRLRAGERQLRQRDRQLYDDLIATRKDMAGIYTNATRVCLAHGDGPHAEQLWQRAAALHPQDTNCRQGLAWYYLQLQRPLDTIRMLEELARLEPQNSSYQLEIARLHLTLNQIEPAQKVLEELCATSPQEPAAHATLAEVYLRRNKPVEALQSAREAVELDPSPSNLVLLTAAREQNGDLAGALQSLQQAIDKDSTNVQYREMYALLKQKVEGPNEK